MNPFIIQIIEAVLAVLKDCPAPAATKRGWLKKPKGTHKVLVWLKVRKTMKLSDFNDNWPEAAKLGANASTAELNAFLAQAA